MNGQLILSYPIWFIAFCILLGIAVAAALYTRDKLFEEQRWLKAILFLFRSTLVSALAFLLLSPIWKGKITETEQPILVYLEDISSSIQSFTPSTTYEDFQTLKTTVLNELEKQFDVEQYQFGGSLVKAGDSLPGVEKMTNISQSLEELLEIHSHQNIGGIVLATDGIYNQGYNPAYSKVNASTSIYTIALGDSTPSRDLFVQALQYPKVVYMGDQFQLDIDWGAYNLSGNSAQLKVTDEQGKVLLTKTIALNKSEVFQRNNIIIDAESAGVKKFNVSLSTSAKEDVSTNNYQSAYVEVLDGRKNVLLVYDGPHPDIKALKTALDNNKNYEVSVTSMARFNGNADLYDLVVMHGLPSKSTNNGKTLFKELKSKGKSIAIIVSERTDLNFLNNNQGLLKIKTSGQRPNEVQGLLNNDFKDFQIPEGLTQALRSNPPLLCPFGEYEEGPNTKTIVYQRLDDINTGYPMILTGQEGASRMLFITGEGIWRWRMSEFEQQDNATAFDGLFNQLIQYSSIKEDKRKFRLFTNKKLIWENEPILFSAELYNANYELINQPDVQLQVKDTKGNAYDFVFDKSINAYVLDAGLLPVGNYTARANTNWTNENYNAAVKFTVREVQLEAMNKQANFSMLYNLSENSGGKLYLANDFSAMVDDLSQNANLKPVLYDKTKSTSIFHYKWIFFALLALLSIEWIVRKWRGGY